MSNNVVAEVVTVSIAGDPIRAEIVEIVDHYVDDYGRFVDVRLADGTDLFRVDPLDVQVFAAACSEFAAA